MEKFIGGDDRDDPSELDTLHLSLPDSFDDSISLDMYRDFIEQSRHDPVTVSKTECHECSRAAGNDEQQERKPHQNDVEQKVQKLIVSNTGSNVYDRKNDALEKRSAKYEAESLRMQLNNEILEYRRQVHLMGIDLERARNESEVFLTRAKKAEKDRETSDDALKRSQQTYEKEILRIHAELEETKLRCEREMGRLREGCSHDIESSRCHQNEAFMRESKLLCYARDQAIEQSKMLQHALSECRSDREKKDAENLDIIIELEKQIADVRSDLKVKACELNTLQACQDRTIADATLLKEELVKNKEALELLQREFSNLERRAVRSEEAVRLKDEELNVYRYDDLLVDYDFIDAEPNSEDCGRRSLMRNSVALARKCRELQSTIKKQSEELQTEREKNTVLSRKEEADQRLFQELSVQNNKNASAYILSTLKARDTEILRLSSDKTTLQVSLNKVAQERDGLSSQISKILERRGQLDEMKALVKSMKNAELPRDDVRRAAAGRTGRIDKDPEIVDEDDLFDHMIHRSYLTLPVANK